MVIHIEVFTMAAPREDPREDPRGNPRGTHLKGLSQPQGPYN